MSEQTTKRRAGRPKKVVQETAVAEAPAVKAEVKPQAPKPSRKPILRKTNVDRDVVYTIPKLGGIVYMIKQKGVTVYDKETDTVRAMRYCPNEPSIWVDEQSDNAKKEAVVFRDGALTVPKEKPNLRIFLEKHPDNFANGGRIFKLLDPTTDAQKRLEKEFKQSEAVSMVRDKDINDLLPVAIYYGINIDRPTADIRYELLNLAKKNPKDFISSFDSPQVIARSIVKQAADYQIIKVKADGVYWFDSNGLIVSVPVGANPDDVMTRFCLTEKGASVLSTLEERLNKLA